MAVADLANTRPVVIGWNDQAVRSDHALHDDGRDLIRALVLDDFFEVADALAAAGLSLQSEGTSIAERVQEVYASWHGRLHSQASVITGQGNGTVRRSMIGAVASQDLVPAGVEASDLDRIFVGFGSPQGKEGFLEISRRDLSQLLPEQAARFSGIPGVDETEPGRLVLDRFDHLGVLVADIGVHQLG